MKTLKNKQLLAVNGGCLHPGQFFRRLWEFIADPFDQDCK